MILGLNLIGINFRLLLIRSKRTRISSSYDYQSLTVSNRY